MSLCGPERAQPGLGSLPGHVYANVRQPPISTLTAASSKTDQAAIARIFAEHGPDGFLDAWLRLRGVDWAADLIPDLSNLIPQATKEAKS